MRNSARLMAGARKFWRDWLRPFAIAAAIVAPFKSAIADWNWVPTGSMKPTILEGDLVMVNKLAYDLKVPFTLQRLSSWSDPKRDEIVVFFSPKDGTRLVKRVIGVPGDTIEMRENVLTVNGEQLGYEAGDAAQFGSELYEDSAPMLALEKSDANSHWMLTLPSRMAPRSFPPVKVPEGQYFMMGDSRDNSLDSRFFGFVPREKIVGRTSRVLVSLDKNHYGVPRLTRTLSALDGAAEEAVRE
jgi:signal peptidase I